MKIQTRGLSENGNALLTTMIITICIGITLAGYLAMVSTQYRSTMRSQKWNETMPVVEAGIEEAIAHLNKNCVPEGMNGDPNPTTDGWSYIGGDTNFLGKSRIIKTSTFGDTYYNVIITMSNAYEPTVMAHAYVPMLASSKSRALFANISNETAAPPMKRTVKVHARTQSYASFGMVSKGGIEMKGKANVDSFDSEDPRYSTNGTWVGTNYIGGDWSETTRMDESQVATTSIDSDDPLNVGNSNIRGTVAITPEGTLTIGNGSVGDNQWVDSGNTGIQEGHLTSDFNASFPNVNPPFTTGLSPRRDVYFTNYVTTTVTNTQGKKIIISTVTTTNIVKYDYVFDGGEPAPNYVTDTIDGKVLILGNANILITGEVSLTGNGELLKITSSDPNDPSTVRIYMDGPSLALGGNGSINNEGSANNLYIFGTKNLEEIKMTGNAVFNGVIYAPDSTLHLGGGGNDKVDFSGAVTAGSVKINGHFNFHYDAAVGRNPINTGYMVSRWDENLLPGEEKDLLADSYISNRTGDNNTSQTPTEPSSTQDVIQR